MALACFWPQELPVIISTRTELRIAVKSYKGISLTNTILPVCFKIIKYSFTPDIPELYL